MTATHKFSMKFSLRETEGSIEITYGRNDDPKQFGFNLLDLPFNIELAQGFPYLKASIKYQSDYYSAFFGWIQTITVHYFDSDEETISMDLMPMNSGLDYPFSFFGFSPIFFDAPGPNPPRNNESGTADTFLVFTPNVARTREIKAITGL